MPRKDLTAERTEQILDALERCIIKMGLGASSLEMIAQEAGVKRSILRHYVGNRDEIVVAMARRLAARMQGQLEEMGGYLTDPSRMDQLLKFLFSAQDSSAYHDVILVEALIPIAAENLEIHGLMTRMVEGTIEFVRDQLRLAFPKADARRAWTVAYGVVGIYFNHESLAALGLPKRHRTAAIASCRALIGTLKNTP